MLRVPSSNSFQRRADEALDDVDALALNGGAIAEGAVFGRYPLVNWSPTSPGSAPGSKAPAPLMDTAPTSLNVQTAPAVTIAEGASVEIAGVSAQSVIFSSTTGTLKLDDSLAFTGQVSGLAGSDAIDLADVSYGIQTQVTFLGNTTGGTLTITDGVHTANIALQGDYLSSTWTLSSDGNGGTVVVDPVASNNWQPLKVGAGGFVDGIDVAPDGTMVVRTDTNGAYIWNGTQWQQLVTSTSMPAAFVAPNSGQGVYEIQIAPSNTNIMYMMLDGYVFQSTNKGVTWTQTAFSPVAESPNDSYRMYGQKMAVDPGNANIVYVGTPQNGLFVTTNGGLTWQSVSAVPVSQTDPSDGQYPGIAGILFDPALGGATGGKTNTIFAASYGNGVYESTNGGASWTALAGGPTDVRYAAVSSTGVYYAVDGTSLWSYASGKWTKLFVDTQGQGVDTVAVSPSNPNEIVVQGSSGVISVSYNGGTSWSGWDWSSAQLSSTDIPWLANTGYMTTGGTVFNPLVPNQLLVSDGVGVWNTSVPQGVTSSTPITWNDQSVGIDQLVATEIIVPPGGDPVVSSWDRPFFYLNNLNAFPSTYGPVAGSNIVGGWSLDYASSNPSFLVGIADWWGTEESGYSTNGGQTWTPFASFPVWAGSAEIGGAIAASSPTDFVWMPTDGYQPYYTLNGGVTWNPVVLPGASGWVNNAAWYTSFRDVTADRVLSNTFYIYTGAGVYQSTNGGQSWTEVFTGAISPWPQNVEFESVPGEAGNLFYTSGYQGGGPAPSYATFSRSTNGGATWTAVPNVLEVICFGFGASATPGGYPSIYIVGSVNNVYGVWQSNNNAQSWTQIGTYPTGELDQITTISGDPNIYGQVYVGFAGGGFAYLSGAPAVAGVASSPSTGTEIAGKTIVLTVAFTNAVTVSGTPTLSLNDGGVAIYTGGSGTTGLTFSYTVAGTDSFVPALSVTQVNLPNGATITSSAGTAADLSSALTTLSGLSVDPLGLPEVLSIAESPSGGALNAGKSVTLTLNLNEAVTVTGGTPTLTLNDGGTATYTGGSGTSALTFSYTVAAGQNTAGLSATGVNFNGATVENGAGNAASLSLSGLTESGPQIVTTPPVVSSIVESPSTGTFSTGGNGTLILSLTEAVTVAGGTPTLTLNDGGTATYTGGSGSNALTFSYTVASGQNTASLAATAVNLNGATVEDVAGNAANLSLSGLTQSGPAIETASPAVSSIVDSPASGVLNAGSTVTITLNTNQAIIVSGGTPTLTLNDGGTATYTGGSGSNALTFSYTVGAGQNTTAL